MSNFLSSMENNKKYYQRMVILQKIFEHEKVESVIIVVSENNNKIFFGVIPTAPWYQAQRRRIGSATAIRWSSAGSKVSEA